MMFGVGRIVSEPHVVKYVIQLKWTAVVQLEPQLQEQEPGLLKELLISAILIA